MIRIIDKSSDSTEKLLNSIIKLANFIVELKPISAHGKDNDDEAEDGDDDIWMNEENQSAFEPLMNNNCFHVDIQEQGHHEMNGVLKNNEYLMQKQWATLNKKMERENGDQTSSHLKLFYDDFVFCDVCYNMSEENVLENL